MADRFGHFLATWLGYKGWPVKVTLQSEPFELPPDCSRLAFTARSTNPGDSIELQLLAATGAASDLGRYRLATSWNTVRAQPRQPTGAAEVTVSPPPNWASRTWGRWVADRLSQTT